MSSTSEVEKGEGRVLSLDVEEVGKRIKASKRRVTFRFCFLGGAEHEVVLDHSVMSGKKKIAVDRRVVYDSKELVVGEFRHPFQLSGHLLSVVIDGKDYEYDLLVDGVEFRSIPKISFLDMRAAQQDAQKAGKDKDKKKASRRRSRASTAGSVSVAPRDMRFDDFVGTSPSSGSTRGRARTSSSSNFQVSFDAAPAAAAPAPAPAAPAAEFDPFADPAPAAAAPAPAPASGGLDDLFGSMAVTAPAPAVAAAAAPAAAAADPWGADPFAADTGFAGSAPAPAPAAVAPPPVPQPALVVDPFAGPMTTAPATSTPTNGNDPFAQQQVETPQYQRDMRNLVNMDDLFSSATAAPAAAAPAETRRRSVAELQAQTPKLFGASLPPAGTNVMQTTHSAQPPPLQSNPFSGDPFAAPMMAAANAGGVPARSMPMNMGMGMSMPMAAGGASMGMPSMAPAAAAPAAAPSTSALDSLDPFANFQ